MKDCTTGIYSCSEASNWVFLFIIRREMTVSATGLFSGLTRITGAALSIHNLMRAQSALVAALLLFERLSNRRNDIYNILWAVVFGFATLNILSLAARRFEANRRGLSFGELMALLIVLLSIFLLGWELLSVFHIFPIRLHR
jgi:hypothetical protein